MIDFDLARVYHRGPQVLLKDSFDTNGPANRAKQEIAQAGNERVHVGWFRLKTLLAREGEKLRGEFGASLSGLGCAIQKATDLFIADTVRCKLEVAQHGRQQVIEVVCNAARHLTHQFHLLGVQQC